MENDQEEDDHDHDGDEMSTPTKRRKQNNQSIRKKRTSALSTPRTPRTKKDLTITPLKLRPLPSSQLDSPYKLAQARLHVSAVPTSLPCRDEEHNQIYDYLEGAIDEGNGACIYISGVPGTGKTATVREVITSLRERAAADVPIFGIG